MEGRKSLSVTRFGRCVVQGGGGEALQSWEQRHQGWAWSGRRLSCPQSPAVIPEAGGPGEDPPPPLWRALKNLAGICRMGFLDGAPHGPTRGVSWRARWAPHCMFPEISLSAPLSLGAISRPPDIAAEVSPGPFAPSSPLPSPYPLLPLYCPPTPPAWPGLEIALPP